VRDPVVLAVERVVGLVLERVEHVLVVRDQVGVHRHHIAALEQPSARVARCRDRVVLSGPHQLDHLVRGVSDLDVDLTAGLLLERRHPVDLRVGGAVLDVSGPGDEVDLALTLAELAQRLTAAVAFVIVVVAAAGGEREHEDDEPGGDQPRDPRGIASDSSHCVSSLSVVETATV
jgi:hypothetical protein